MNLDRIEMVGRKTESVKITVSARDLKIKVEEILRSKYDLVGNWLSNDGQNVMREDSDYHSEWDVIDRPATDLDRKVLAFIDTLHELFKE